MERTLLSFLVIFNYINQISPQQKKKNKKKNQTNSRIILIRSAIVSLSLLSIFSIQQCLQINSVVYTLTLSSWIKPFRSLSLSTFSCCSSYILSILLSSMWYLSTRISTTKSRVSLNIFFLCSSYSLINQLYHYHFLIIIHYFHHFSCRLALPFLSSEARL